MVLSTPSCQYFHLNSTESLFSTCSDAVDYDFYVPTHTSLADLEEMARSLLNNSAYQYFIPNACLVSLKKLVCANVYLKCQPGVDLSDTSTWNTNIYPSLGQYVPSIPLPYQRPCMSVCTSVTSDCYGLLKLSVFSYNPSCSATKNYGGVSNSSYSTPAQYDSSNNASVCNAMSVSIAVGEAKEAYQGSVCSGIVTDVYIPPSSALPIGGLAPVRAPYVIQGELEALLSAKMGMLPVWMKSDCHMSLRKLLCSSVFLSAETINIHSLLSRSLTTAAMSLLTLRLTSMGVSASHFYGLDVSLPSYPHYDVCVTMVSSCASLALRSNVSSLHPNCNGTATLSNGLVVRKFPTANQTILSIPLGLLGSVAMQTGPNTMLSVDETSVSYTPQCPSSYVVPEDPFDPRVRWVPGTACAAQCR